MFSLRRNISSYKKLFKSALSSYFPSPIEHSTKLFSAHSLSQNILKFNSNEISFKRMTSSAASNKVFKLNF